MSPRSASSASRDGAARTLLLVTHRPLEYGGPGGIRWRYFAEHLPEHGWSVSVLTSRHNATRDELAEDPRSVRLFNARARVMGVVGRTTRPLANAAGIQPEALAPSILWSWTVRATLRARVATERPDVVVSTTPPPAALFALTAALRPGPLPLVADMRDPWAGHPTYDAGGRTLTRIEGRALAKVDAVVGVTDGMVDKLARLHPAVRDRLHCLPNGFDPRLLQRRRPRAAAAGRRVTLVHPGVLYGERSLEPVVAAIAASGLAARLRLELIGNTNAALDATLAAAPPELVVDVAGPRSWAETMDRVAAADVVVVIVPRSMGDDVAWPVKMFEALALGKPILAVTSGGATEELLRSLGQGAGCARDDDPGAIVLALRRVVDDPPPPVDPARIARFDRAAVTRDYAALLDNLADR